MQKSDKVLFFVMLILADVGVAAITVLILRAAFG